MNRSLVALALALVIATPFAMAGARSETVDYVAAGGDVLVNCMGIGVNVGGGCFALDGSEGSVTITIDDDVFGSIGGFYSFSDADFNGNSISSAPFCAATTVDVPSGAVMLFVYVDQAFNVIDCLEASVGTTGTITADFV